MFEIQVIFNALQCKYNSPENKGALLCFLPRRKCQMKLSCFFLHKKLKDLLGVSAGANGGPFISTRR
jgi:hypothetical protein